MISVIPECRFPESGQVRENPPEYSIITGFLIIGIGYQVGKIYRKYCWDIISIMVAIISTAIVIYYGEWIKSVIPINLIVLLLLVHVIYIGIRCYVKDWQEERGYY